MKLFLLQYTIFQLDIDYVRLIIAFLPPPHSFEQGEQPIIVQANFFFFFLIVFDFSLLPTITVVGGCVTSSFRSPPCRLRLRRVGDKLFRRFDLEDRKSNVLYERRQIVQLDSREALAQIPVSCKGVSAESESNDRCMKDFHRRLPQDILQMLRLNIKDKDEKLNVKDGRKCKNKAIKTTKN